MHLGGVLQYIGNKLSTPPAHPLGSDLQIGGVRLVVSANTALRPRVSNPLYIPFLAKPAKAEGDLLLKIRWLIGSLPRLRGMAKIYDTEHSWSMYRHEGYFWLRLAAQPQADPFLVARFDPRLDDATVYSGMPRLEDKNNVALAHPVCLPLDQVLLMHFLAWRRGFLLHAAGLVVQQKAFLFTGSSGAGKSTISRLLAESKKGKPLSDERVIVREIENVFHAFGTPWAGTEEISGNCQAPLAGIFFLKHGKGNHIERLDACTAGDRMLSLASIPWYDPDAAAAIIAFSKQVVAAVPCYEFSFTPDPSAVDFFCKFQKSAS